MILLGTDHDHSLRLLSTTTRLLKLPFSTKIDDLTTKVKAFLWLWSVWNSWTLTCTCGKKALFSKRPKRDQQIWSFNEKYNRIAQWKMDGNKRNLNCFYGIFAKKRNSHGHFKYIKKHKIIPRNCCFSVITLCSPKKFQHVILTLHR